MAIVGHVGGYEGPLWEGLAVQRGLEAGKVLNQAKASRVVRHALVQDQRIVLADIVVGVGVLVREVEALESGVGDVLLVLCPRDALGVEKIHHRGDVCGDGEEVVVVHAKVVTTDHGTVIWLGWMCGGPVVG